MPAKQFTVEGIGEIHAYKRRGARSIRLSIASDGRVRVTLPFWVPYAAGLEFVKTRRDWILEHQPPAKALLVPGQKIGKAHRLQFSASDVVKPTSRIGGSAIRISHPPDMDHRHPGVQSVAEAASIRALRKQAEALLPGRLQKLAETGGFTYTSVQVKLLKSRWGSCDNKQRIVLNLYLMQLPWELIDYVIMHELVHTKHMNHGKDFWDEFVRHEPRARELRRTIRTFRPILEAL